MHNKIFLLLLLIVSFAFAIFSGGKILYLLVYEFAFFILLNYLYIRHIKNSIYIHVISHKNEITVGEEIAYEVTLINNSFFPVFNLKIIDYSSLNAKFKSEEWYLMPFKNKKVQKKFVITKRGIYFLGPFEVEIKDPFGIFKVVKKYDFKLKFVVLPRVHNIEVELKARQQLGNIEAENKAFEDYTNISQLRKYNYGDSIKRIHWKVSAKKREFYVKEFQVSAMSEVYILWDLDKNHFAMDTQGIMDENSAECMLSIAKFCLLHGIPVSVIDYNTGMVQVKGRRIKDFKNFIEVSLRNFPVYEKSLEDFLRLYKSIPYDITLILITPYLNNVILGELVNLRSSNRELIIYYVNDPKEIEDKINKLDIEVVFWGKKDVKRAKKEFA